MSDMNTYEFTLTFALPEGQTDPEQYIDALFEAGCDDAVVGTGMPGSISLGFVRDADSATDAVNSAIRNVMQAIPRAELTEAMPDLVGLSDVADILQCSRQNVRKYMVNYREFPRPAHSGKSQLWHLWEVARFPKFVVPRPIVDIAQTTFQINLDIQKHKSERLQDENAHFV